MDSMERVIAMEMGSRGITVNAVGSGLTLTETTSGQPKEMHEQIAAMTPLGRIGMPQDVAGAVVFLSSSLSDDLTGTFSPVDFNIPNGYENLV